MSSEVPTARRSFATLLAVLAVRLSPLVLVLLAACSRAPDMASCRLIGTWELPPSPSPAQTAGSQSDTSWVDEARKAGGWPSERFDADGNFVTNGILHPGVVSPTTWRIVDDDAQGLTIEIAAPERKDHGLRRTIVFETNDRIRDDTGLVLVRVHPQK